mgnify:CR=1 FL=1
MSFLTKNEARVLSHVLDAPDFACDGVGNVVCTPSCADCPVYKSWEQSVETLRKKALPPAARRKSSPNQILLRKLRADAAWEKVRIQAQERKESDSLDINEGEKCASDPYTI